MSRRIYEKPEKNLQGKIWGQLPIFKALFAFSIGHPKAQLRQVTGAIEFPCFSRHRLHLK